MFHRALTSATIIASGLMTLSCSDDAAATGSTANASQQALLAVNATQYIADGTSSYVALVPNLDTDTAIDYANVFELPGNGRIWNSDKLPNTFIAVDDQAATITKYTLDANAALSPQGTLGFERFGITVFPAESRPRIDVVDTHKAYLFDALSAQAIVFDPDAMVASHAIDLSGLAKDDWSLVFGESETLVRGQHLMVFGSYVDLRSERFSNELRVAAIDTDTDDVSYLTDGRCPASVAARTASGDIYFSSGGLVAAYHRIQPDESAQPCMLRILSGDDTLDSFEIKLSDLTDGSATGGLIPAGDDTAYVLSLEEGLTTVTESTRGSELYGAPNWRWWRIELGQTTPGTRADHPISTTGSSVFFEVGDQAYANDTTANNSSTTLLRTSTDGDPEPGIGVRGVLHNVVRMR